MAETLALLSERVVSSAGRRASLAAAMITTGHVAAAVKGCHDTCIIVLDGGYL